MMDYQIQANTRRCTATGRELQPGERIYSVLREEQGKLVRQDFGRDAWQGPPPGAFSFWAGKVPGRDEDRRPRIDDDLLMDCFRRLQGQTEQVRFRYVVALLLLRRKRLKFESSRVEDGREILCFRDPRTREAHEAANPNLTEGEIAAVQEDVFKVLGWE